MKPLLIVVSYFELMNLQAEDSKTVLNTALLRVVDCLCQLKPKKNRVTPNKNQVNHCSFLILVSNKDEAQVQDYL